MAGEVPAPASVMVEIPTDAMGPKPFTRPGLVPARPVSLRPCPLEQRQREGGLGSAEFIPQQGRFPNGCLRVPEVPERCRGGSAGPGSEPGPVPARGAPRAPASPQSRAPHPRGQPGPSCKTRRKQQEEPS